MNAEQALLKLEDHFRRLLSEVFVFKSLYSERETFDLLEKHLNDLFASFQRPLMDSIVLCICRLLDPAETCGNDNITFYYLAGVIPREGNALIVKLNDLKRELQPLRDLRNKIIGHSDLIAYTQSRIEYRGASHDEIFEALPKLNKILEFCSSVVRGHSVEYHIEEFSNGGPEAIREILSGLR